MILRKLLFPLLLIALVGLPACGGDDDDKDSGSAAKPLAASSDTKKVAKASASAQGLKGEDKGTIKGGGANALQPGDTLDVSGLDDHIIQVVKEKTGLDVRADCPQTVQYAPGSVFYCKLYLPDGTAFDVKVTQQEGGRVQWEVITSQPVPEPPPGGPTGELKGTEGEDKATRGGAADAFQPGDTLDISGLGDQIEQAVKQQTGLDVNVECPPTVEYSPGSTFYCKLVTSDGTTYDVECVQQPNGGIAWRVVTRTPPPGSS